MTTVDSPSLAVLASLLVAATWCDLRTHRIPNVLIAGGALTGLALLLHPVPSLATLGAALAGAATGLALFLPFYALGKTGAGDVKLLAVVGVYLGPLGTVWAALWTLIFGGLLAVAWLVAGHRLRGSARRPVDPSGTLAPAAPGPGSSPNAKMPYAAAIALGTLASVVFGA